MIAGALVLVGLIAAGVTLGLQGWKSEQIVGLLVAVGTAGGGLLQVLNKLSSVQQATADQNAVLATISHNTNGVLSAKINSAIDAAIPRLVAAVREAWDEPVPLVPTSQYERDAAAAGYPPGWTPDNPTPAASWAPPWGTPAAGRHRDPLDDVA